MKKCEGCGGFMQPSTERPYQATCFTCHKVSIYDVDNAEAFVIGTINRARLNLDPDERDELLAEGMALMIRLAGNYKPYIEGHERNDGRFSGYAAMYLPRKLGDAWHRIQEGHRLTTGDNGKRKWKYEEKPISLNGIQESDPHGTDHLRALQYEDKPETELAAQLRPVLTEKAMREVDLTVQVGVMLGEERSLSEISQLLGIRGSEVNECVERLRQIANRLEAVAA